jgi:hypothetical protein
MVALSLSNFLRREEDAGIRSYGNHSYLEEVMEMVSGLQIERFFSGIFHCAIHPN